MIPQTMSHTKTRPSHHRNHFLLEALGSRKAMVIGSPARVQPSDALQVMIWPWLDYVYAHVMSNEEENLPTASQTLVW